MDFRHCVTLIVVCCLIGSSAAQDATALDALFQQGAQLEARQPADVAGAARLYEQAARQGHTPSMLRLGYLLQNGAGVPADLPGALGWFTSAANAGNSDGQFMLAMTYAEGLGTPKNAVATRKLLLQAAPENQFAQYALGVMMAGGEGGAKKMAGARRWLDRATAGPDPSIVARAAELRDKIDKILFSPDNSGTALLIPLGTAILVGAAMQGEGGGDSGGNVAAGSSVSGKGSSVPYKTPCRPIPMPMGSSMTPNGRFISNPRGPYYMGGC